MNVLEFTAAGINIHWLLTDCSTCHVLPLSDCLLKVTLCRWYTTQSANHTRPLAANTTAQKQNKFMHFITTASLHLMTRCTVVSVPWLVYRGRCTVVGVPWSVYRGRCTVVGVPWSVYRGRCTVVSVPWSVYRGQCTVVSEPWSVNRGQCTVVSVPWLVYRGQCTVDWKFVGTL
jgi:hypothetical protein